MSTISVSASVVALSALMTAKTQHPKKAKVLELKQEPPSQRCTVGVRVALGQESTQYTRSLIRFALEAFEFVCAITEWNGRPAHAFAVPLLEETLQML